MRVIVAVALGTSAALFSSTAEAADIASIIGEVGSSDWQTNCPGAQQAPTGASQLPNCPGGGMDCLHRVVIDPAEFPNATCSDGSPGVFYARAGVGVDADRWLIHLQGGGNCRSQAECLERWCGQQGPLPYMANKMSSTGQGPAGPGVPIVLPEHVIGPGMASANVNNAFSTWSHVWVYYCSSDNWLGTESDVLLDDALPEFSLNFRGHTILYAVRNMLRKLNPNAGWTAAGEHDMPDLDDATMIVLSGTSAGAHGVLANVDWFFEAFPDSDNSAVIDADFLPGWWITVVEQWRVDYDLDEQGDAYFSDVMFELLHDLWDEHFADIDAFHDATCKDANFASGEMERCDEHTLLLTQTHGGVPMIETPIFARLDLADNVLSRSFTQHPNDFGWSVVEGWGPGGSPTTIADYADVMRQSLLEAYVYGDTVTGLFAPRCGDHVGLEDGYVFTQVTTPDTSDTTGLPIAGTRMNLHDAIWTWLDVGGGGTRVPIRRVDTGAPGAGYSGC